MPRLINGIFLSAGRLQVAQIRRGQNKRPPVQVVFYSKCISTFPYFQASAACMAAAAFSTKRAATLQARLLL